MPSIDVELGAGESAQGAEGDGATVRPVRFAPAGSHLGAFESAQRAEGEEATVRPVRSAPAAVHMYSRQLKERTLTREQATIFRSTPMKRVLLRMAVVFAEQIQEKDIVGANPDLVQRAHAESGESSASWSAAAQTTIGDTHRTSDAIFYASEEGTSIGIFISHVWGAPRWQKYLALCYYTNKTAASIAAVTVWLIAYAVLVLWNGIEAYRDRRALVLLTLVHAPVLVFLVCLFFGHSFIPYLGSSSVWLDKLCIHQTRSNLKVAGVTAVPEFVANSQRMLILWSETYFERLWCNAEIATFCALNGTTSLDIMPLWVAPWVVSMLVLELICATLLESEVAQFSHDVHDDVWNVVFHYLFLTPLRITVCYLPVLVPTCWALRQQVKQHSLMFQQLKNFELQAAKCTVESDRSVVEGQVARLFEENDQLGRNLSNTGVELVRPIDRFNNYVQHELKDIIALRVGHVTQIPFFTVWTAAMPMFFGHLAGDLVVGGRNPKYFESLYVGPRTNFLVQGFAMLIIVVCVVPSCYLVMLRFLVRCTQKLQHASFKNWVVCALAVLGGWMYLGIVAGGVSTLLFSAVFTGHPGWYLAFVLYLILLLVWNYHLFIKKERPLHLVSRPAQKV